METLEDICKSANQVDLSKQNAMNGKIETLLACEKHAGIRLHVPTGGTPELDAKFKRIDLNLALRSVVRQKGIPFPVPRFAAIDVEAESCSLGYSLGDGEVIDGDSSTPLDHSVLLVGMRRHVRIRTTLWTMPFLAVATLLVWSAIMIGPSAGQGIGQAGGRSVLALIVLFAGLISTGCMSWTRATISLKLGEVLPGSARKKVNARLHTGPRSAPADRFSSMYVIVEANKWAFSREPVVFRGDPLLVGYSNGAFYLVDKFDLTPAEEWLSKEFAQ